MENAYDTVQVRQLDAAIDKVLGADAARHLASIGWTRPLRHKHACLRAFELGLSGPHIDQLREALVLLDGGETYPVEMWLLP